MGVEALEAHPSPGSFAPEEVELQTAVCEGVVDSSQVLRSGDREPHPLGESTEQRCLGVFSPGESTAWEFPETPEEPSRWPRYSTSGCALPSCLTLRSESSSESERTCT